MRDVSRRVYEAIQEALRSGGFGADAGRLLEGELAELGDWSTWDQWLEFLEGVAVLTRDRGGLRELGKYFPRVESFRHLRRIYAVFTTPKLNYLLVGRWVGNSVFPWVNCDTVDLQDGRLQQTLTLPDSYRDSAEFFELMWGALIASPNFLGLPSAHVEMVRERRRATYVILPPPSMSLASRCARAFRTLRTGVNDDAIELFSRMVEQLQESNREIHTQWERAEAHGRELNTALAENRRVTEALAKAREELEWQLREQELQQADDDPLMARLKVLARGTLDRRLLTRIADFLEAADESDL